MHLCHLKNHWNHFHTPIYHSWCACFCCQTSLVSNTTQEIIHRQSIPTHQHSWHQGAVKMATTTKPTILFFSKAKLTSLTVEPGLTATPLTADIYYINEYLKNLDCPSIHFNYTQTTRNDQFSRHWSTFSARLSTTLYIKWYHQNQKIHTCIVRW